MIIYRLKNKTNGKIYSVLYDKQRAEERLNEACQGVYRKNGWPKGEYFIEIVEMENQHYDNERIF